MKCPKCGNYAIWCENKEIYGKNYGKSYMVWLCKPCDVYVGCHNNTKQPLGIMTDRETRKLKMNIKNKWLDLMEKRYGSRRSAHYRDLSETLEIPIEKAHFGMFDKEMLLKVKSAYGF